MQISGRMSVARGTAQVPAEPSTTRDEVLDTITDGFIALDAAWRYVFINRAAERYLGRPRERLLGRVVWEVFPEAVGTELEAQYRRAAGGTEPIEFENVSPVTGRWLSQRVFPGPNGLVVYFRDVTERHQAEHALREAEARWRAVFDNAHEALMLTAPTGEILAVNRAAERLFGHSADELCRLGRGAIVDATDPRLGRLLGERALNGRASGALRMRRADGSTFEAEVASGVFLDAQNRARTSMSIRDLTERKRDESALQLIADAGRALVSSLEVDETLGNLTALLVPSFADVCVVDAVAHGERAKRTVAGVNQQLVEQASAFGAPSSALVEPVMERVLRSGTAELVTRVTDAWIHDATLSAEQARAVRALGATSAIVVPMMSRGQSLGVIALARCQGRPAFDDADLQLARSVSDRAALALENANLFADAVRANQLREDVLSIVSHDLRNPLNAVAIAAQLIARGDDPKDNVALIRNAVARANRLIADLLLASQLESGKVPLELERHAPRELLQASAALHEPLARAKDLTLEVAGAPELPDIRVDRHRFEQALGNLVGNAIKFTKPGGRITLRAERSDDGVVITVADTGAGIEAADLPHLFDRFWQGAHAKRGGAGLGLSIARGMVEAHGGRLSVESTLGVGTTFSMWLPSLTPGGRRD